MTRVLSMGIVLGMLAGSGCSQSVEIGDGDPWPPRPSGGSTDSDTGELVFRLADFGLADPSIEPVGRNLDGYDTTLSTREETQCTSPSGEQAPIDGEGGIDNVFSTSFIQVIDLVFPCAQELLEEEQRVGRGTLLLRIEAWNGEANDPRVTASLLVAADGTSAGVDAVQWNATTSELVLASDGTTPAPDPAGVETDVYFPRPDGFLGAGTLALVRHAEAYVAEGTLVFFLPEVAQIPLLMGPLALALRLTDGLILAELSADFSSIAAGTLTGRFGLADIVDAAPGIGMCGPILDSFESQAQRVADVRVQRDVEGGDCDALSVGFPFTGVAATLAATGGALTLAGSNPPLPTPCDTPENTVCP